MSPRPAPRCSTIVNCSGNAFSVKTLLNGSTASCLCTCRNYWSGPACNVCPSGYSGTDCDTCPAGTLNPSCRLCNVTTDCSGNAIDVSLNFDSTQCQCRCRNKWSGRFCSLCDATRYSGNDCNQCATGLSNYPSCVNLTQGAPNSTVALQKCNTTCVSARCSGASVTLISGDFLCSCSNCVPITNFVCAQPMSGLPLTAPRRCSYPTSNCLTIQGMPKCVLYLNGTSRWYDCQPC